MITDLLREGQEIIVQIAKEPIAAKGARITSHIALPGRFLVYMPTIEHVGVSRKIESDSERQRLRKLHDAPRSGALAVTCVFSREPVAMPGGDDCAVDGSLNCHGYGSSVAATATFGLGAASRTIDFATARATPARRWPGDSTRTASSEWRASQYSFHPVFRPSVPSTSQT